MSVDPGESCQWVAQTIKMCWTLCKSRFLRKLSSSRDLVTHYLCVIYRELLMKVVWQAGMAMVWWPSCNQLRSELKLGLKREKKRGSSKYLAEIVDASEICCTISASSQKILKKVILGDDKCITLFCDWTPPRECSGTLLNSNHLLYFKVECGTTLFLMQSIVYIVVVWKIEEDKLPHVTTADKYGRESCDTNAK